MPLLIPFFSDPAYPAPQSIAILLFLPCNSTTKHLHPSQGPPPGVPSLAFAVPEQKGRHQEQNLDLRSVFQPLQRHRQEATAFLVLTSSSRSAFTQPWSTRLARGWGEKESLSWLYADGNFTHRPLSHTSGDWLAVAKKPRFWSERISPGAHKQAREKKKKKKGGPHKKLPEAADLPGEDSADPSVIYITSFSSDFRDSNAFLRSPLWRCPVPVFFPTESNPSLSSFSPVLPLSFSLKSIQVSTLQNRELNDFPQASQADLAHQHKTYNLQVIFPTL